MNTENITIDRLDIRKLLSAACADAALLYLYIKNGGALEDREEQLHMSASRLSYAETVLRQLDLWPRRQAASLPGERPNYSETDVLQAMDADRDFQALYGEIQRLMGRTLNTEELKILLSMVRYLGLPGEVISMLVCYCKERARQRGSLRNPSLRNIEKEAYVWADQGIDTLEAAAAYIQTQNLRASRMAELMGVLQIRGRSLTAAEERYAESWLELGFDMEVIAMAYERTCLNTGGLKWPYMNTILQRWHEAGLHTKEQVRSGDQKPGVKIGPRKLDDDEKAAIARIMREE